MEKERELNQYELNPVKVDCRMNFLPRCDQQNVESKLYYLHRFLSNQNIVGQVIPERDRFMQNIYYDEFYILAECWDVGKIDIDLMLIELCNGGDSLHKLADWIFRMSPLMRPHSELVAHSKKFRDAHLSEQKRLKDQLEEIQNDREAGRGSRGGEKDFIVPFL